MTPDDLSRLIDWILAQGLAGRPETELLPALCNRLIAADVPVLRANIYEPTLHPIVGGHLFIWWRGDRQAVREDWDRGGGPQAGGPQAGEAQASGEQSPFDHMIAAQKATVRIRLAERDRGAGFPLFETFRSKGGTDYFAIQVPFGAGRVLGQVDRVLLSWVTDAAMGFGARHIEVFQRLAGALALAVKDASNVHIAHSVIGTYLGEDAGRRVLSGEIERGAGETIRAALWYCDLEGFTALADTTPPDRLIAMLDDYFDCMVTTLNAHGGQVLKFMGDGLLAIFALEDDAASCRAALDAAERAQERLAAVSAERAAAGLPVSAFDIALHLGEVMYGNIGARRRLDFTVLGPAVNEASRIESLCRFLQRRLLVSAAFAGAAAGNAGRLVSLGEHRLRGVQAPQELFTLRPDRDPL